MTFRMNHLFTVPLIDGLLVLGIEARWVIVRQDK